MRVAAETRIQVLRDELKAIRGELSKAKADLIGAKARICTAMADFKRSPVFESYIESRRQQWVSYFHRSEGFIVEMQQATLAGTNRMLGKLKAFHPK